MKTRHNILAFAYVFPPDAGSGTYRTLYFSNNWARHGDNVTIITAKERDFSPDAAIDVGLCRQIDESIRVVRTAVWRPLQRLQNTHNNLRGNAPVVKKIASTKAVSRHENTPWIVSLIRSLNDLVSDLLTCPDQHVGWVPTAVGRGWQIVTTQPINCIYASGGPWSCLLAAAILHKLTGIKLLLDFRDPWVSSINMSFRPFLSQFIQTKMESFCVKAATKIIVNTEELREDFIKRYPSIKATRFVTITNGFENIQDNSYSHGDRFTLLHAGGLYSNRNPTNLFRAVKDLLKGEVIAPSTFRLQLVGGISINDPTLASELQPLKSNGTLEIIPRVPHDEVLQFQRAASALLIIQTGFPLQVPRKLYEYISIDRPILAIAEDYSATARTVNDLQLGHVANNSIESIKATIMELYQDWKTGKNHSPNRDKLEAYSNRNLSDRLRSLMSEK